MNILMLSATFPYPPTRGGTSVRTFNLLKYLKQQGHRISLATLRTDEVTDSEVEALANWVDDLAVFERPTLVPQTRKPQNAIKKLERLANFAISGVPPNVSTAHSSSNAGLG